MRSLFVIVFCFLYSVIFACDCKDYSLDQARKINYDNHELIIVGTIIEESAENYKVLVEDVFKGVSDSIIIGSINKCSFKPKKGERWLIYTNYQPDGTIIIDRCSFSRSYSQPINGIVYTVPPPPPPGEETEGYRKEYEMEMKILRLHALVDLVDEINMLRYNKLKLEKAE